MISVASHNLKSLGFTTKQIVLSRASISEYCPPLPPTLIVTNPPYGLRLDVGGEDDLKKVYRSLGDFLKRRCAKPSKAWILSGNLKLNKEIGLAIKRRHVFWNGRLESRLLEVDIY
jgi:putative N6-adenine-specific DNA methylase